MQLLAEEDEHVVLQFPITFVLVNIPTPKIDNFAVLTLCKMKISTELCRAMCCMVFLVLEALVGL